MKMRSVSGSSNSALKSILYKHNVDAVLRTIKNGKNICRRFYGCPLWPQNGCNFFMFEKETDCSVGNRRAEIGSFADDVFEKKPMEEKIMKLKTKNKILKNQVTELKTEVKLLKLAVLGLAMCLFLLFACTCVVKSIV
ncbi:hypothetical protein RND81_06G066600 [Saponaria officinalis]|uniref:GRF-type domain-containing protein n=1 Tax=Saponaria officinalis TaxID=3572 RepID=A0AAW1K8K4_SAPOF